MAARRVHVHRSWGKPLALAPGSNSCTMCSRCAAGNGRGAPGTGLGAKALAPPARQAARHWYTALTAACTRRATSRKLNPCARSATARRRRRSHVLADP
jgi:hypothetical protein